VINYHIIMAFQNHESYKHGGLATISMIVASNTPSDSEKDDFSSLGQYQANLASSPRPTQLGSLCSRMYSHLRRSLGATLGLLALVVTLATIPASFGILYASDRQPIESWKWQPAVYLAIFVAIADKALQFAAAQGAIIAWWYNASKGTTYAKVHQQWAMSYHLSSALTAGKRTNAVALACVAAAVFILNGPLIQRATSVERIVLGTSQTLSLNIAPQVPANSTGSMAVQTTSFFGEMNLGYQYPYTTSEFYPVVKDQYTQAPISGGITGCSGRCAATVPAPALTIAKSNTTSYPVNYSRPFNKEERKTNAKGMINLHYLAMDIEMSVIAGDPETLILAIGLSDAAAARTGVGHYVLTDYWLVPATASYNIEVEEGAITFPSMPSYPDIIARANNTGTSYDMPQLLRQGVYNVTSTLGGLAFAGLNQFFALAGVEPASAATGGAPALMQLGDPVVVLEHQINYAEFFNGSEPGPLLQDPTDYIIGWLNQLMFRAGIWAAQTYTEDQLQHLIDPGLSVQKTVTGRRIDAQSVFITDYYYFAGVAALEVLAVLVVLSTFYGCWTLDRPVSFSPLEIAKYVPHSMNSST
jgi:hypothetical protein